MKQYNSIDLFKFVMALFVIVIHITNIKEITDNIYIQNIYSTIVGCAVPFFFISMGFLMAKHMEEPYLSVKNTDIILSNLKRLTYMYLKMSIIYFPFAVYGYIINDESLLKSILLYIRGFIFIGEHYNSCHLWFLLSSVYSLLLVFLLRKYFSFKPNKILCVGTIIFLISLFIDWFVEQEKVSNVLTILKSLIIYSILNGRILQGCFFIPLGMYMANYEYKDKLKISIIMYICLFVISIFVENIILKGLTKSVIAISLFYIILNIKLPQRKIWYTFRKMSTFFYNSHMYFFTIVYMIFGKEIPEIIAFILIVVFCSMFYFVFDKLKHNKKMHILDSFFCAANEKCKKVDDFLQKIR